MYYFLMASAIIGIIGAIGMIRAEKRRREESKRQIEEFERDHPPGIEKTDN